MRRKYERKELDWHTGDFERKFGFSGGKYTDVNLFFVLFVTVLLSGALIAGLCFLPTATHDYRPIALLLDRGWTPYAMIVLFVFSIFLLFDKSRKLAFQKKALALEIVPVGESFALTSETALEILKKLNDSVDDPKRFVLFNRIERALLNLKNVGNVSDVSEMLRAQAENDENHLDSSYGVLAGVVWAIPILGFIGTVVGLSGAIGGFGLALNASTEISSLRESLTPVTSNLAVAFDTTFLALILAMVVQLFQTLLRKNEESFMDACREYAHVNIISKLKIKDPQAA